jgi:hypothetical protein
MVPQEVPTTLALVGAADTGRSGRSSPSLAQAGGDLPAWGGARCEADLQDPIAAIVTLAMRWRIRSGGTSLTHCLL